MARGRKPTKIKYVPPKTLDWRKCTECGRAWDLSPEFWHRQGEGFHTICKACRLENARKSDPAARVKVVRTYPVNQTMAGNLLDKLGGHNFATIKEPLEMVRVEVEGVEPDVLERQGVRVMWWWR